MVLDNLYPSRIIVGAEEVDIAVVIDEDETMGSGAVFHVLNVYIVELTHPVKGLDGLVLGVVGHQLVFHDGIDAVTDWDVLRADGVGRVNAPTAKGLGCSETGQQHLYGQNHGKLKTLPV